MGSARKSEGGTKKKPLPRAELQQG
ncbi:hypothetical protein CCHR01_09090 [Colletotrichum chrysophilum]|uniref:Uncharacterized protein n=1 Tax=Colletotrichum chrysophilum TaxID=1836956 RepID=A0AAD9EI15_9PEZI|nr:hypothetical protein CCHR01_09090 [Colletotrichum chrysophilum]